MCVLWIWRVWNNFSNAFNTLTILFEEIAQSVWNYYYLVYNISRCFPKHFTFIVQMSLFIISSPIINYKIVLIHHIITWTTSSLITLVHETFPCRLRMYALPVPNPCIYENCTRPSLYTCGWPWGLCWLVSNIRRTKSQNLNVSRLVLELSLPNPLKPDVKSRMKM